MRRASSGVRRCASVGETASRSRSWSSVRSKRRAGSAADSAAAVWRRSSCRQLASVFAFPLQRLGVSPDGSGVVFEVNDEFRSPGSRLAPEQEGMFFVRSDGRSVPRYLGRAEPRAGVSPPDASPSPPPIAFSPNGRRIAFTDLGPGPGGEEAVQIVVLDLATGRAHAGDASPLRHAATGPFGLPFLLTCCPTVHRQRDGPLPDVRRSRWLEPGAQRRCLHRPDRRHQAEARPHADRPAGQPRRSELRGDRGSAPTSSAWPPRNSGEHPNDPPSALPDHRGLPPGRQEPPPAHELPPRGHVHRVPERHPEARVLHGLRRPARDEPLSETARCSPSTPSVAGCARSPTSTQRSRVHPGCLARVARIARNRLRVLSGRLSRPGDEGRRVRVQLRPARCQPLRRPALRHAPRRIRAPPADRRRWLSRSTRTAACASSSPARSRTRLCRTEPPTEDNPRRRHRRGA